VAKVERTAKMQSVVHFDSREHVVEKLVKLNKDYIALNHTYAIAKGNTWRDFTPNGKWIDRTVSRLGNEMS
jgi:hypothetical protein